jgi:general stress protein 26
MTFSHGLGILATIEQGTPRLRPLEFTQVEGEWWAPTSRRVQQTLAQCDGQHVEILFVDDNANDSRIRGVLTCSADPNDYQHLCELQPEHAPNPGTAEPPLVVVKVIPKKE